MSSWGEGYVTDLGYTHGFYRHLASSHLNYTALFLATSLQDLEPIPYAQTCLAHQGHPVPGLSPEDDPEQALAEHLALFQQDWMPVLAGLGIVHGTSDSGLTLAETSG